MKPSPELTFVIKICVFSETLESLLKGFDSNYSVVFMDPQFSYNNM